MYPFDEIAPITNCEEAREAWALFFNRFYSPEIPPDVDVSFKSDLKKFTPRADKSKKTDHSDDFEDFLNGQTIEIPDYMKLKKRGLKKARYKILNGISDDSLEHVYYALWLFKQNQITRQQMATILARAQVPNEYPVVYTFNIFEDNGKLTREFLDLLTPVIQRSWFSATSQNLSREKFERFLWLLNQMPQSEQMFFLSEHNPQIINDAKNTLGNALQRNLSWHQIKYNGETYDIHLSFGIIEAMQIAESGFNGAAANPIYLGILSIDTIKAGIEKNFRPTAISIPESKVQAPSDNIHGWSDTPLPVVTQHDVFHAKLHNTIPPSFHLMLNHLNQILIQHTNRPWSKTAWALVDREFILFFNKKLILDSPKSGAHIFMMLFEYYEKQAIYLFRDSSAEFLNDDGFAIFWDMVNEPQLWKKLFWIDTNQFEKPFSGHLNEIKQFKEQVGAQEPSEILTLKYRFFRMYPNTKEFKLICELIDDLAKNSKLKLEFKKEAQICQKIRQDIKNITTLYLGNVPVYEMNLHKILPQLVNLNLGDSGDNIIPTDSEEFFKQFKSIHRINGSTFSKESLEAFLKNIPSNRQKLEFLETCYTKICESEHYTRRHVRLDSFFSWIRNDLTTSQRTHINILKNQYREIFKEYTHEWFIKSRKSDLIECNTNRFCLNVSFSRG
jgi:hypothetical protein